MTICAYLESIRPFVCLFVYLCIYLASYVSLIFISAHGILPKFMVHLSEKTAKLAEAKLRINTSGDSDVLEEGTHANTEPAIRDKLLPVSA